MDSLPVTEVHVPKRKSGRAGRPPRELAGEVNERILDAARRVFLKHGLSGTSIDEIARLARAGQPPLRSRRADASYSATVPPRQPDCATAYTPPEARDTLHAACCDSSTTTGAEPVAETWHPRRAPRYASISTCWLPCPTSNIPRKALPERNKTITSPQGRNSMSRPTSHQPSLPLLREHEGAGQ